MTQQKNEIWVSDLIKTDEGINFKLNCAGSSVPFWVKGAEEKDLPEILAIISREQEAGKNIVEISELLKEGK